MKPFSRRDETSLKQGFARMGFDQTTGCDHAGHNHQPVLPAVLQGSPFRNPAPKSYVGLRRAI
jgi:hypothetical protein